MEINYLYLLDAMQLLLLIYLGSTSLYLFIFAIASLFPYKRKKPHDFKKRRFALLIPCYREDEVIIEVSKSALSQNYPKSHFDVIVIADKFEQKTIKKLKDLPIILYNEDFPVSTKTRALNHALINLPDNKYDVVCILDADNLMEPDFLGKVNDSFSNGYIAVQGHRVAKNMNTNFAILDAISEEVNNNPNLWNQRHKLEGFEIQDIDDFEELDDEERDAFESILSDPRKFKLFTTAKSIHEIQQEASEVKRLFEMAQSLFNRKQEEKKFQELNALLKSNGVLEKGEKLVLFTEHKDTLIYLEERLTKSGGYKVATIHGGKTVDERRQAQWQFASPDTQILIGTDAAGEGINLQFCRLLINWDIPWNPNRLEQRMGRIHRYGQKQDVLVFNMVATNTKEGKVLERLLTKLDIIREGIGDDRVYDVIQDVLENINLESIIKSVFNGEETALNAFLAEDNEQIKIKFREKIKEQKEKLAHSNVDFKDARLLKEDSDEKRLQPIYIKLFFEKAFRYLGGDFTEIRNNIFRIEKLPDEVTLTLRSDHNIFADAIRSIQFCFDKQVFLDYQLLKDLGIVHYINPGNPLFDALVKVVRNKFREDMLKGTVLISPDDKTDFFAFFVKSQITDNRPSKKEDSIADELLFMVNKNNQGGFSITSPAKFIDLHPPTSFTKEIIPPPVITNEEVVGWCFENITQKQFADTTHHVLKDVETRQNYLESAFVQVIMDLQVEIQEFQSRVLLGDAKVQDKIIQKQQRIKT